MDALYQAYKANPSVQTDTRKLAPGSIFFALRGPSFNGNHFAAAAIDKGAAVAVIDDPAYEIPGKTVLVPDALKHLQALALHHRKQLNIPVLAITGSNGKTTTKELIHVVLSAAKKTCTTEGNLNNHIGVPLTLLSIAADADIAVIEMGANHLKEIASYCEIAQPTHGLITNCGKAHLEGFGSEEGVRKGKGELFDYLRETGGTAFVMKDYNYLTEMAAGISHIHTYGTSGAGVTGIVAGNSRQLSVQMQSGMEGMISTKLVGDYNLPNVLAAVAVGLHFGIATEKIRNAIEGYAPNNSRSQLMERNGHTIILDAYNANPSSMKAAIQNFASGNASSKLLALGAMAELGESTHAEHAALIREIDAHKWTDVVLVGNGFADIDHHYHWFESPEAAGAWLKDRFPVGTNWLIKGSRSMQMEKLLQYI